MGRIVRNILLTLLLTIIASVPAVSQKVGLVLSGGGAKGMAHIGLIRALEENNIPIDYITGTSMGAIIGSLYAMGYSPDEMQELISSDEFRRWYTGEKDMSYQFYFKQPPPTPSIVQAGLAVRDSMTIIRPMTNSVVDPLQMNLAFVDVYSGASAACGNDFDKLMVPFRAVASDVFKKSSIVLGKGDLGNAVRASMSLPFVFSPIRIDSIIAYDGGIYDNFPVDVMIDEFNPDFIIGSVVAMSTDRADNYTLPDEYDLMGQVRSMIMQRSDYSLDPEKGVKLDFNLDDVGMLDFQKINLVERIGYLNTLPMIDSIKGRLAARRDSVELSNMRQEFKKHVPPMVFSNIEVSGVNSAQRRYISKEFNADGGLFDFEDFKMGYFKILSDEAIKTVLPGTEMNPEDSTFNLKLDITIDDHPTFNLGGCISSGNTSQLYGAVSYRHIGEASTSFHLEGQIGRVYNNAQFMIRNDLATRIPMALSMQFAYNNMNYFNSGQGFVSSDNISPALNKEIEFFSKLKMSRPFLNNYKAVFSIGVAHHKDYYSQSTNIDIDNFKYDCTRHNMLGGSVMFTGSTLNSVQYPTRGHSETIIAHIFTENSLFRPENRRSDDYSSIDQSWLQMSIEANRYYRISNHVAFGVNVKSYYSSRNFASNYYASVMQAGKYEPTVNSRFQFDPAFRANAFIAGGIKPIWIINNVFHIRSEFYGFLPARTIINVEGNPEYGNGLDGLQFMSEFSFVAQYNRLNFNVYFNATSSSSRSATFGVTLGILMPNEWFIE
ncbi:MAG: patatin-like phospholipase family protein [Bacteroidaceae bacterium]|nr:patatin-like phospholipase family protein [Bacteroidaceae bacterium]